MSGGRPASLDGSLLARKGAAAPAISDESPLVLHLDGQGSEPAGPEPGPEAKQPHGTAGLAAVAGSGLRRILARLAAVSPRVRLLVIAAAAVGVIAILWPSYNPSDSSPVRADSPSGALPAVAAGNPGLKLNVTAVSQPPVKQADPAGAREPSAAAVAAPVAVALAVSDPSNGGTAATQTLTAGIGTAPLSRPVIPASATSGATAPPVGGVDPTPEIPVTVPKSVSPVPVPRAKPDVAAVPAGPYAVQLASIASEKRANKEAFRLQKYLGRILSGREIMVEKAVVKGKGTTYRLRASGYRTYAEARAACSQVVRLKVNCLALRR